MTILALLRKFRRHYLWAEKVYKNLSRLGVLSLKIDGYKVEGGGFQVRAQNQVPNQDLITRLAILMYPLLDPGSTLYWQHILAVLEEKFPEEIPQALREQLTAHARRLSQTSIIPIIFHNERLDPQQLYLQMARGVYFSQEPQAQSEIERLRTDQLMDPILWHCFYDYTLTGFELTSVLYCIFLELSKTAIYQQLYDEQSRPGPGQCIYCRTSEACFSTEEHVFPEGLGNDEIILLHRTHFFY